jgi:hypothetical protein
VFPQSRLCLLASPGRSRRTSEKSGRELKSPELRDYCPDAASFSAMIGSYRGVNIDVADGVSDGSAAAI